MAFRRPAHPVQPGSRVHVSLLALSAQLRTRIRAFALVVCLGMVPATPAFSDSAEPGQAAGAVFTVDNIVLEGTRRVKSATILRELALKPGDNWSPEAIELSRQRLYKTQLFSRVEIHSDFDQSDRRAQLTVAVQERYAILPLPTFSRSQDGTIKTGLDYKDDNFLGLGHRLGVNWKRGFRAAGSGFPGEFYGFRYDYPRLRGSRFGLSTGADYDKSAVELRDATGEMQEYVTRGYGLRVGINHLNDWGTLRLSQSVQLFHQLREPDGASNPDMSSRQATGLSFSLGLDATETDVLTTEGFRMGLSFSQTLRSLGSDTNTLTISTEAIRYWRGNSASNLIARVQVATQLGDTTLDCLQVGGDGSIRGTGRSAYWGSRSLVINTELRSPLWIPKRQSRLGEAYGLAAFVDAGNAWKSGESLRPWDLHLGVGAGARVPLRRLAKGTLRLDVGYGLDERKARVYAGIGQPF